MKKLLVFLIAAFMLTATYAEPKKKPTNITEKVAEEKKGKAKDKKEAKKPKKLNVKVKRPEELKQEKEASKKK